MFNQLLFLWIHHLLFVFVNCDRDVMDVFDLVGVIPYFTFLST